MRVLLVTHYFPPEVGAPQARLSELARAWAADGVAVTVLTGMPNHPVVLGNSTWTLANTPEDSGIGMASLAVLRTFYARDRLGPASLSQSGRTIWMTTC